MHSPTSVKIQPSRDTRRQAFINRGCPVWPIIACSSNAIECVGLYDCYNIPAFPISTSYHSKQSRTVSVHNMNRVIFGHQLSSSGEGHESSKTFSCNIAVVVVCFTGKSTCMNVFILTDKWNSGTWQIQDSWKTF